MEINQSRIPSEYLAKCAVLCLYFPEEPYRPAQMVSDLSTMIAGMLRIDTEMRFSTLVQTKDIKKIIRDQSLEGFSRKKFHIKKTDSLKNNFLSRIPDGKQIIVVSEFGHRRSINQQPFSALTIRYSENSGWDAVSEDNFGGFSLTISVCPWLLEFPIHPFDVFVQNILKITNEHGKLCHGVFDYDYFIANLSGLFYDGTLVSPCLKERLSSQMGWATNGGVDRIFLCRDPREVLILGAENATKIGIQSQCGESTWRLRHKAIPDHLKIIHCHHGEVLLACSSDPLDFSQTVRSSSKVRGLSGGLFSILCEEGLSLKEYKISHKETIELYDSMGF